MKRLKILLALIVLTVLVIFAVSNTQRMAIYFWGHSIIGSQPITGTPKTAIGGGSITEEPAMLDREPRTLPIFLWLFITFAGGYLCSWLIGLTEFGRLKFGLRKSRKEQLSLTSELRELRARPITDQPSAAEPPPPETY